MDREALRDSMPDPRAYERWPCADRKLAMQRVVGAFLDAIEADGREPDDWEYKLIPQALTSLATGNYNYAYTNVHEALTPPGLRSPDAILLGPPQTLQQLREHLAHTIKQPARER